VLGGEAKELGLVDHLGNCDSVMEKNYPDIKIENFSVTSKWENLASAFGGAMMKGYNA
jgi:ClpP class serine protease